MREIIFRGKRIDNGEWVYGYYVRNEHMGIIKHIIITDWAQVYVNSFKVDPDTLGQFSGLRDNKRTAEFPEGQRIFEGDIVNFDGGIARVEWCNDLACYLAVFADVSDVMLHAISHRCAVIGNIHEHKNLLGGEVD